MRGKKVQGRMAGSSEGNDGNNNNDWALSCMALWRFIDCEKK